MKHAVLRRFKRLTDQRWKIRELLRKLRKEMDRKLSALLRSSFTSLYTGIDDRNYGPCLFPKLTGEGRIRFDGKPLFHPSQLRDSTDWWEIGEGEKSRVPQAKLIMSCTERMPASFMKP